MGPRSFAPRRRCTYNRRTLGNQGRGRWRMPWTNSSGGNGSGGPKGPWSRGPASSGGGPDFEDILRRSQDRLRSLLPGPGFGTGSLLVLLLIIVVVWLLSGIYIVGTSEQGIVLRFGA